MGNGKRTMIIVIALFVVTALIAVLAMGFHGRHIGRNAAAMATPVGIPTQPVTPRP